MAETTKKTSAKTTAKTTGKTGAKKTARKTTTKATASRPAAKKTAKKTAKTTASTTASRTPDRAPVRKAPATTTPANAPAGRVNPSPTPLYQRDAGALLETAGYAATGLAHDVIELARVLPTRLDDAPAIVRELRTEAPKRAEATLTALRERLARDVQRTLDQVAGVVDGKAADGKRIVDDVVRDERFARVLDQTANTRSQLKAALTSVTRTADVTADAASEQASTARRQVKAATTSVQHSAEDAGSAVKGAVTSIRKVADVAADAASKQATTARSQVKAAATSVRRSAETVVDAVEETVEDRNA
jgi:hypothetical protein